MSDLDIARDDLEDSERMYTLAKWSIFLFIFSMICTAAVVGLQPVLHHMGLTGIFIPLAFIALVGIGIFGSLTLVLGVELTRFIKVFGIIVVM